MAKTQNEKDSFSQLEKDLKSFLALLQKIPRGELSLYFSAYQSFIWNDVVRRLIRQEVH